MFVDSIFATAMYSMENLQPFTSLLVLGIEKGSCFTTSEGILYRSSAIIPSCILISRYVKCGRYFTKSKD